MAADMWYVILSLPSFYDDVAEPVAAVAGRRGPAHIDNEDELVLVGPLHKHPHKDDVPCAQHHLTLAVRLAVRGVLVQRHLSDEVAFLGGEGEVDNTGEREKEKARGKLGEREIRWGGDRKSGNGKHWSCPISCLLVQCDMAHTVYLSFK